MRNSLSRRTFLKVAATSMGAGLLAACVPSSVPTPAAQPEAAATTAPEAAATTAPAAPAASGAGGKFVIMSSASSTERIGPWLQAIQETLGDTKLEFRTLTSERYTELFTASEVAGDQIDLMDLNGQDLRRYAVGGKVMDLTDQIGYKDRFRPIGLETYTISGKLWALPMGGISGFTFLYNKKALDKIGATKEPETYDDILQMAPDLEKAGYAPFVHAGKNIYLWPVWQFFAYAQTSGNQAVDNTWKTLSGQTKFTDDEHVAALDILYKYAQDKMFTDSVNSLDSDGAWINFSQGKSAFWYEHTYRIGTFRAGQFPELDLSLIPPVRSVPDPNVKRQLPGGTGSAEAIYAKISGDRLPTALKVLDLITSDKWVKFMNDLNGDPVSCNANVQASDDEIAVKYANECADLQFTYLDWYWPPEITRAFQENQQGLVAGTTTPKDAAQAIQKVLDQMYQDGYKFEM